MKRLIIGLLGALFIALGISISAPEAHACCSHQDPNVLNSNEQKFINDMALYGIGPTNSARQLANEGWVVCGVLIRHELTRRGAAYQIEANSDLSLYQASQYVNLAVEDLCPPSVIGFQV